MYEIIQKRPWIFPLSLAPVPLVVSWLGIAANMGIELALRLIFQPALVETDSTAPWPIILRPVMIGGLLIGLFAWLAVALPRSVALKKRKMQQKRGVTALASFFTAGALWLSIVLGDVAWRLAVIGSGGLQEAQWLEKFPWIYFMVVFGTAGLLYGLVRPRARPRT